MDEAVSALALMKFSLLGKTDTGHLELVGCCVHDGRTRCQRGGFQTGTILLPPVDIS